VPAIAETVPGYDYALWTALFAPATVPADVLATLHRDTVRAMDGPDLQSKMRAVGLQPTSSTPRELGDMVRRYVTLVEAIAQGKSK
jgi:tripartite-type tricarboxylate transporter receptor subunit TctC